MAKIVKNNTASPLVISDTGITIPASSQYAIQTGEDYLWAASNDLVTALGSGDATINDGTSDLSNSEGLDLIKGLFPKKISVGNSALNQFLAFAGDRLKVDTVPGTNPTGSSGGPLCVSPKLRYDDMNVSNGGVARGTSIADTAFVDVYTYSGTGLIFGFLLNLESNTKDWDVKLTVDGEEIFTSNGLWLKELDSNQIYDINHPHDHGWVDFHLESKKFVWSAPKNYPMCYSTNVTISIKRHTGKGSKKFRAGLIRLTKES